MQWDRNDQSALTSTISCIDTEALLAKDSEMKDALRSISHQMRSETHMTESMLTYVYGKCAAAGHAGGRIAARTQQQHAQRELQTELDKHRAEMEDWDRDAAEYMRRSQEQVDEVREITRLARKSVADRDEEIDNLKAQVREKGQLIGRLEGKVERQDKEIKHQKRKRAEQKQALRRARLALTDERDE